MYLILHIFAQALFRECQDLEILLLKKIHKQQLFVEQGLTYPQFLVMMSLWNKDNVFIKELTEQTLLDAATLTAILKKLELKNFIKCNQSDKDKRAKVIRLTETGKALKNKTSHIFKNMECRLKLTKIEQKQLIATCHNILSRLS
jgi:DNA-binding MarR family transcriptional regulator